MKRKLKRAVAAISALAVLLSVGVCAAADNKTSVEKVTVVKATTSERKEFPKPFSDVKLTVGDVLEVTIKLSDETGNAVNGGAVTFLSSVPNGELNDTTIQYIDQQISDETNGTIMVRFRPRKTIGPGTFIARAGGENVTTPLGEFTYTVEEAAKTMTLDAVDASVVQGSEEAATFKLKVADSDSLPQDVTIKVTLNNEEMAAAAFTYNKDTGEIAITNASAYAVNENYTVTVSADGYTDASTTLAVTEPETTIDPDDDKLVGDALDTITATPSPENNKSVTLPATVPGKEKNYPVTYTLAEANENVTLTGNTLTLTGNVFAARATVTAKVGTKTVQKTVYIVPAGKVSFGNIGLFANGDGEDAFTNNPDFAAVIAKDNTVEFERERAVALSLALNKATPDTLNGQLPTFETLDYDGNDVITLAEYRVFKLMIAGTTGFKPDDIAEARK